MAPEHPSIDTSAALGQWPHADHRGMWLTVFRLRALFIWAVGAVAGYGAWRGWLHPGVAAALILVVLPYNALLHRSTARTGTPSPLMGYGDQLLCAAFVLIFPETLTTAMVAATFDLATAASVFSRRTTLRAGAVGLAGFSVALLVSGASTSGATLLSVPAYGVAVVTLGTLITSVSRRERDARVRFAALVDGLDAVVWEYEVSSGRLTFVNAAIVDLVGYRPAEWIADPGLRVRSLHPDDRNEVLRRIRSAVVDGQDYEHTCRLRRADGTMIWVRELVTTEQDERGRAVRLRGTAIDITEAREAQLSLAARNHQQHALVEIGDSAVREATTDAFFGSLVAVVAEVVDVDLVHVMRYDPDRHEATLAAQWGWRGDVTGKTFASGPHSHVAFTAAHPAPVLFEDLRSEQRFTVLPDLLEQGAVSGLGVAIAGPTAAFGTLALYTRHERSFGPEDVLFVQSVANLIAGVVARADVETQLLQAQKMEAVGQLAGGMAHDFNNLLTAVLGYAELLVPSVQGDDFGVRALSELREAGQRAAALVDQLLTFSRGHLRPPGPVDLNAVVASAQSLLSRLLGDDIAVTTDMQPVDPVEADGHQLEQLIVNLAVNARDAMPIGGVFSIATTTVDLDAQTARSNDLASGRYVRLRCSDTGVGMDEHTLRRAFEPFFTTKEPGKGTGLGLASAYAIVRNAGGQINITSAPGSGTTVTVWIPASEIAPPAHSALPEVVEPASGTETILLVEDQATVQALLCQVLTQHGYRVVLAADGQEAANLLTSGATAHLMVTDVVMPQLSGPDLVSLVLPDHSGMRVLYISGYADQADLPIAAAGTDFLHKPFGVSEFLGKVRGLLDGSRVPIG